KYLKILLICMISPIHTMDSDNNPLQTDAYSPILQRAYSDSALYMTSKHYESDDESSDDESTEIDTDNNDSLSTQTDSENIDELQSLFLHTSNPQADLSAIYRNLATWPKN